VIHADGRTHQGLMQQEHICVSWQDNRQQSWPVQKWFSRDYERRGYVPVNGKTVDELYEVMQMQCAVYSTS